MIKIYRDKDQRVHKAKSFIVPDSMKYYPFLVYSFLNSELLNKKILRKLSSIEYLRRELMHESPVRFILEIAPLIYDLSYYTIADPSEKFILPPRLSTLEYIFSPKDCCLVDKGTELILVCPPQCPYAEDICLLAAQKDQYPISPDSDLRTDTYAGWQTYYLIDHLMAMRHRSTVSLASSFDSRCSIEGFKDFLMQLHEVATGN